MGTTRIGIIGDFNPGNPTHIATNQSLQHAAAALGITVEVIWPPTGEHYDPSTYDALLGSPGSPYQSLEGALNGIRYAREHGVSFLGTCGGFQHVILEYAHNVLGVKEAAHAEMDPDASVLFLTKLTCSLVGKTMSVELAPGSMARSAYGVDRAEEAYYCNFGLNPEYRNALTEAGLQVSGTDQDGEVRIVELRDHPFFVGTLFVPQARSTPEVPHPLVVQFCRAAAGIVGIKR